MATDESVSARVQALEDERDIVRTLYDYAHSLDYGVEELFLDCFTDDAIWRGKRREIEGRSRPTQLREGKAAVREFFTTHSHAPELFHKHLVADIRVTSLTGDSARVESYLVRVDEHVDGSYIRAFGRYTDSLVRGSDGRWRIKERIAEVEDWISKSGA